MIKRIITTQIILAAFLINVYCQDTIIYGYDVVLASDMSSYGNVDVVGTNSITLSAGFNFSADANSSMNLRTDVYAVTEPTGFSPNTSQDSIAGLDLNMPVGKIDGGAGVSGSGAATYTIPIRVPKGTAGLEPGISLRYNSQNSTTGILGKSWSLAALSAITASGKNYYYDGEKGAISSTDSLSRLYWDGQRLFGINGKGLEADSFKTEILSYTKIEMKSGAAGRYFEIKTPDGHTLIYGQTDNAQMHLSSTLEWKWMLEKAIDRIGNTILYSYTKDSIKNQILLNKIEYGGGFADPVNEISFHYSTKVNTKSYYLRNNKIVDDKLLDSITIKSNSTYIGSYAINYQSVNHDYLLNECVKYDKDDYRYNSTLFQWQFPSDSLSISDTIVSIQSGVNYAYFTGDYNGDGFTDLISVKLDTTYNSYAYYLYEGSVTGLSGTVSETGALPRSFTANFWEDIKDALNDECGTYSSSSYIPDISYVLSGDFDGDGKDELLVKIMEWNALANHLPADINDVSAMDSLWSKGFNGFVDTICDYEDHIVHPKINNLTFGLGRFIHFDQPISSDNRITNIRLGSDADTLNWDSKYPDILGKGYPAFVDNNKLKYYDIENDTAVAVLTTSGGQTWADLNGDGQADKINQDGDHFKINLKHEYDRLLVMQSGIEGLFIGTVDLNNDGTSAYVYLGPPEYEYTTIGDIWFEYCSNYCGDDGQPIDMNAWESFLADSSLEVRFNDFKDSICGGVGDLVCVQAFWDEIQRSKYLGRDFIISHDIGITYFGPTFNLGKDFIPDLQDPYVIGADLNADGKNELLIYDNTSLKKVLYNLEYMTEENYFEYNIYPDTTSSNNNQLLLRRGNISSFIGDYNGDGINEIISPTSNKKFTFNLTDDSGYYIESIRDGLGNQTRIHYKPLTDTSVYTMGTGAVNPVIDFSAPWYVVSSIASDNGVASADSVEYYYNEGKIHIEGKGFLGFMETSRKHVNSNSETITMRDVDDSFYHPYTKKTLSKINAVNIGSTDYKMNITSGDASLSKVYKIQTDTLIQSDLLNNVTTNTYFSYNSNSQVSNKTTQVGSTATVSESYTYENAGWYFPYKVNTITKQFSRGANSDQYVTDIDYYSNGLIKSVENFSGTNQSATILYSDYNDFGLPGKISKLGKFGKDLNVDSVAVRVNYSSNGRFPVVYKGESNNNIYLDYDLATGLLESVTSTNDFVKEYVYGPFGIPEKQLDYDLKQTVSKLFWSCGHSDAPTGSAFYSWSKKSGHKEQLVFYDRVGRPLRTVSYGFDESKLFTDIQYDNRGRVTNTTLPYESGNTIRWDSISYDNYGRIQEQTAHDGTSTEFTYSALWKRTTVSKGASTQQMEVTYNALGEVIQSKDPMGNIVYTNYYPNGLVKETYSSVNPSEKITIAYDSQGNKTEIDDPDAGVSTFTYDSFGQLIKQINAKGDTTSLDYDKSGRIIQSTDARGVMNYNYIADTTLASFGKVDSIYFSDGSHWESFSYGADYGRVTKSTIHMPGRTFTNEYSYDWFGRPLTQTYPSGFNVLYSYNDIGYLDEIIANGSSIWSCNAVNELGQITSYSQGDYNTSVDFDPFGILEEVTTGSVMNMKYGFDDAGNLSWREDVLTSQKEVFDYDNMNRLTEIEYYDNGNLVSGATMDIGYGNDGNIISKTDVGQDINYGDGTAGPHALTEIEVPALTFRGPPQDISYTAFNKVSTISDTIHQDTTLTLSFTYGISNQRVKSILKRNSTVEKIKYFYGDYEEDSLSNGDVRKYHYIHAPNGLTAVHVETDTSGTLYHVLTDHLGSISAVINSETDAVTKYSYNAWGMPRQNDDWTESYTGSLFADRGYTGHEHLSEFNLINMNGRVYDPVLARFLSPDPFVQFPGLADGLNRYSYVMNNPLLYIDPTGFLTQAEFDDIIFNLWNSDFGGKWSESGGMHYYSSTGEATAAGQRYMAQHGNGGGGSWQPVYNVTIDISGRPGHFENKALFHKARWKWIKGNFNIDITSELIGWEWVSSEESIFTIDFFSVDAFEDPDFSFNDLVKPRDENITGLVPSKNNSEREYPNTYIGRWADYTRIPEITMDNQSQANDQVQNFLNQANQAIQDYNTQVYNFYRDFNDPLYAIRSRRLDIASGLFIKTLSLGIDVFFYFYVPTPYIPHLVPDPNLIDPDIFY